MFSHIVIGANDVAASKAFYDAVLGALGVPAGNLEPVKGRVYSRHNGAMLMVTKPVNGQPATFANGATLGLAAASPQAVYAAHAAGVANGGTTAEDPPGVRYPGTDRAMYLGYLRDPVGNKICLTHIMS